MDCDVGTNANSTASTTDSVTAALNILLDQIGSAIFANIPPELIRFSVALYALLIKEDDSANVCQVLSGIPALATDLQIKNISKLFVSKQIIAEFLELRPLYVPGILMEMQMVLESHGQNTHDAHIHKFLAQISLLQNIIQHCIAEISAQDTLLHSKEEWVANWVTFAQRSRDMHVFKPKSQEEWDQLRVSTTRRANRMKVETLQDNIISINADLNAMIQIGNVQKDQIHVGEYNVVDDIKKDQLSDAKEILIGMFADFFIAKALAEENVLQQRWSTAISKLVKVDEDDQDNELMQNAITGIDHDSAVQRIEERF